MNSLGSTVSSEPRATYSLDEQLCAGCPIRNFAFCAGVPEKDLSRLAIVRTVRTFEPGTALFEEGDEVTHIHAVVSGCVRTYKMLADGRRQIIGFTMAGGLLGLSFADLHETSVEAIETTRVCGIARNDLMQLMDDYHSLERRLLFFLGQRLSAAQDQMLVLGRKTPLEKLASMLCCLSVKMSDDGSAQPVFRLPMSRTDIADYLGLTIETVSRSFSRLRAEGIIDLSGRDIVEVCDRDRLEQLAGKQTASRLR